MSASFLNRHLGILVVIKPTKGYVGVKAVEIKQQVRISKREDRLSANRYAIQESIYVVREDGHLSRDLGRISGESV